MGAKKLTPEEQYDCDVEAAQANYERALLKAKKAFYAAVNAAFRAFAKMPNADND